MLRTALITVIITVLAHLAMAQGPCYLPGQTPPLAIPVCGTSAFVQDSVSICDGMAIPVPCQDGIIYMDKNPFWYKFHCFQTGVIGFLVVPNNPTDDYDWMLFDVTGKNPMAVYTDTSCIVAYNWSGMVGNTGTAPNTTDSNSCASATDTTNGGIVTPNQTKMPLLIQGHDYLLMVSHFTNTQVGYQITFGGGNAVITDTLLPFMKYARAICDGTTMMLVTNKKMRCTSLDANGSDFSLSPPSANIISAVGNCYGGFDFDTVRVTLNHPLPPGKYNLVVNLGADGNTLEDICYNDIPVGSTIPVNVYPMYATPMDSINTTDSCNPSSVNLVFRRPLKCSSIAPDGSDFIVTGPSAVSIASTTFSCNSDSTVANITINFTQPITVGGNYTVQLVTGSDGNTVIDECGFESYAFQTIPFRVAAPFVNPIKGLNTICVNGTTTLTSATKQGSWSVSNSQIISINQQGVVVGLSPGNASVTYKAIGANGCAGYVQYPLVVNPTPQASSISGGRNICMGNMDTLKDADLGGIWYSLDNSIATIDSITGIATPVSMGSTSIQYKIVNQFGCSDSASIPVSVYPLPVIAPIAGANAVCINNTIQYSDITPKGIWESTDTTLAIIDYQGNIYPTKSGGLTIRYIVVSRQGCTDSVFKNITINALPVIPGITGAKDICIGQSANLFNSIAGGQWVSANAAIATINAGGTINAVTAGRDSIRYIVTANGCVDSVATIINVRALPIVDAILGNLPVCVNDSERLICIPAGGVWTVLPASIATVNNMGWIKAVNSGAVRVTYTVTNAFGCIDSSIAFLVAKALPTPNFNIPGNICLPDGIGNFYNLSFPNSAGTNYVWDFGDSANPVNAITFNAVHQFKQPIQSSGYIIKLQATNADNCTASTTQWLSPSAIHAQPTSSIGTIPAPPTVCVGTDIQFFDNSTNTVKQSIWYLGNNVIDTAFTVDYTYPMVGTYWVTHNIIDQFGCISTPSQVLVTIDSFPIVHAGSLQYVIQGSSINLQPTYIADSATVVWSPATYLNNNNIVNPVSTPLSDITYTLRVWNKGGCSAQDTVRIIVLNEIKIPNAFSPNGDGPHDEWVIPELSKYPDASVIVFNRYGQKVYESSHGYTTPWNGRYNGTRVPVGVYYYVIKRNESLPVLSGTLSIFW